MNHAPKENSIVQSFLQVVEGRRSLSIMHSDLCGKMNEKSLRGAEYFLSFIDDKSRYVDMGIFS